MDWVIIFAEHSNIPVGIVQRLDMFHADKESVHSVYQLQEKGKVKMNTHAKVKKVNRGESTESINLHQKDRGPKTIPVN